MRFAFFNVLLLLQALMMPSLTKAADVEAQTEIERSETIQVELAPTLPNGKTRTTCSDEFDKSLTTQVNLWVEAGMTSCLGHQTTFSGLAMTANDNESPVVRRGLRQADQANRDLLHYNCNTCKTIACKKWCGCTLCPDDDDSRRRLIAKDVNHAGGPHKEVSAYVKTEAVAWLQANDENQCMGPPSELKVMVHFF